MTADISNALPATLKARLYRQLYPPAWPGHGLSPTNKIIAVVILASVLTVIVESEPTIAHPYRNVFSVLNAIFAFVFLIEYGIRLWSAGENPRYAGFFGHLRYAMTPTAIIDLVAFLPYFIFVGTSDTFIIRVVRILRLFSLAKFGRYSLALRYIGQAIFDRRFELIVTAAIAFGVLLVSATAIYLVEGRAQPQAFGSIPRALWWSIVTLTTVGYGDVAPVTVIGRIMGGITAIAAIGLIALPTGILAAAFNDALSRRAVERRNKDGDPETTTDK
jgi:voltage-gated potassium channel